MNVAQLFDDNGVDVLWPTVLTDFVYDGSELQ